MEKNKITVEVAYAAPDTQCVLTVELGTGSTLAEAISLSGITSLYSEIDLTKQQVGVFGKVSKLDDLLQEGDRVEIYRPLLQDPKEIRRKKARKK